MNVSQLIVCFHFAACCYFLCFLLFISVKSPTKKVLSYNSVVGHFSCHRNYHCNRCFK